MSDVAVLKHVLVLRCHEKHCTHAVDADWEKHVSRMKTILRHKQPTFCHYVNVFPYLPQSGKSETNVVTWSLCERACLTTRYVDTLFVWKRFSWRYLHVANYSSPRRNNQGTHYISWFLARSATITWSVYFSQFSLIHAIMASQMAR